MAEDGGVAHLQFSSELGRNVDLHTSVAAGVMTGMDAGGAPDMEKSETPAMRW